MYCDFWNNEIKSPPVSSMQYSNCRTIYMKKKLQCANILSLSLSLNILESIYHPATLRIISLGGRANTSILFLNILSKCYANMIYIFQIENESKNKVLSNLEKITSDYQQMKKENQSMIEKIKHKSWCWTLWCELKKKSFMLTLYHFMHAACIHH